MRSACVSVCVCVCLCVYVCVCARARVFVYLCVLLSTSHLELLWGLLRFLASPLPSLIIFPASCHWALILPMIRRSRWGIGFYFASFSLASPLLLRLLMNVFTIATPPNRRLHEPENKEYSPLQAAIFFFSKRDRLVFTITST